MKLSTIIELPVITTAIAFCLATTLAFTDISNAFVPQLKAQRRQQVEDVNSPCALEVGVRSSPPVSSSRLFVSSFVEPTQQPSDLSDDEDVTEFPKQDKNGIYILENAHQHAALVEANQDKLIVMKFYAPWCRACKALGPKYVQVVKANQDFPIVFAEMTISGNKGFAKDLGVLALPTIQFYVGEAGLQDTFPCGPSKVPILKRKLNALIKANVDATTNLLKPTAVVEDDDGEDALTETIKFPSDARSEQPELVIPQSERLLMQNTIPYFSELSLADFDAVMDKARLKTFEPGSTIVKEGRWGRTFYVLKEGDVEMYQKTGSGSALTTSSSNLGTVINRLGPGDFFGERAILTGEPRACSVRAVDEPVQCWIFDKSVFPASSGLSGRTRQEEGALPDLNKKYGVKEVTEAPQQVVDSVDTSPSAEEMKKTDAIFSLLARFRMVRQVSRCFDYVVNNRLRWGDAGSRIRRAMLVERLRPAHRVEFKDVFELIDTSGDGVISLSELKRVMDSVGETKTEDELTTVMKDGADEGGMSSIAYVDGLPTAGISLQDFLGIMAEAEFYYLFRDIFSSLDPEGTGYVRAKDLDRALSGVRDLISDDRKSIIDVGDEDDLLIDYDQFSRMLLGGALA